MNSAKRRIKTLSIGGDITNFRLTYLHDHAKGYEPAIIIERITISDDDHYLKSGHDMIRIFRGKKVWRSRTILKASTFYKIGMFLNECLVNDPELIDIKDC